MKSAAGPLSHLTVVEFAGLGPAPFAGMMLADQGARVIRIDRPPKKGGQAGGKAGGRGEGMGALTARHSDVLSRGRESIALDLKQAAAREVALRLIAQADVLIEGFRPGVMESLGLGPEVCLQRRPSLVYGRVTGWGQTGPLAQSAGHDINYVSLSGALLGIGSAAHPLPPLNLVGDYGGGGMLLAMGVMAAVNRAQHSGEGQVVDAAMTDGAALLMAAQYGLMAKGFWTDARESNFLDGAAHFYGTYACLDGKHVSVGAIEPQFYRQLLALCGITDEHFQKQWDQGEWPLLREKLAAVFRTRTRDQWCEILEGTDACFAPVLSMTEAAGHPHNAARGTFVSPGGVVQPAPAPRFDRTPSALPAQAPRTGEHTAQLLARAGLSSAEIEALVAAGVAHPALGS